MFTLLVEFYDKSDARHLPDAVTRTRSVSHVDNVIAGHLDQVKQRVLAAGSSDSDSATSDIRILFQNEDSVQPTSVGGVVGVKEEAHAGVERHTGEDMDSWAFRLTKQIALLIVIQIFY